MNMFPFFLWNAYKCCLAWHFGWKKHWKIVEGSIKLPFYFLFSFFFSFFYKAGNISEATLSANSWRLSQMRALKKLWLKMKGIMKIGKL